MDITNTRTKLSLKERSALTLQNILIFAFLLSFTSCTSFKDIPYFQDLSRTQTSESINNYSLPTIQPEDRISINVNSLNPEASAVFNNNAQSIAITSNDATYGYSVDQKGEIRLPLIGVMKVSGLTTAELTSQLQQRLLTYLKSPTVSVRIINLKVAVLGDVMRPNVYTSASERLTITEALSLAGDLNVTANRKNIILVRERDGKREFVPIDLTSKTLFQSPYFYLRGNDLLVVQPTKLKLANVDTGYRNASLVISALSLVAITYSILK